MARVQLLDDELINKIAAGEVVERPASVVKELVENAIDAGATHVKVILKDGGRQLIQVYDDGSGMTWDDAVLAVKRHTTSKLQSADQLFQVQTMGFRGEALASIASVSRFTLQTQSMGQEGCRVHVEDARQLETVWQGPLGTTISVADLFYNVPARRAFMKNASAEFAACHEYMQALALSLPSTGFTLLHNDREIFSVSPSPKADGLGRGEPAMRARAIGILGREDAEQLVYVQRSDRHGHVEALLSPPGLDKATARSCFTFVNGRWVRDKLLRFAIQRGYHSHLMKGKFPVALLYLTIDPALVDVNVHPAKTELRFQYAPEVQNAVVFAIREALREGAWAGDRTATSKPPQATEPASVDKQTAVQMPSETSLSIAPQDFDLYLPQNSYQVPAPQPATAAAVKRTTMRFDAAPAPVSSSRVRELAPDLFTPPAKAPERRDGSAGSSLLGSALRQGASQETIAADAEAVRTAAKPMAYAQVQKPSAQVPAADGKSIIPWLDLQFIGPFARCFLLFEYQQQLLAIDQHAFHERVLYERLLENPELLRRSQPLLMPEVLEFSPTECERLLVMKEALAALGIAIHGVSATEIEVTAVPSLLVNKDIGSLLGAILGGKDKPSELAHDVLATMACHAAVRAGEDLPEAELKALLKEAESVDFYHNCPHGRRVFRWWKQSQVAAWFDR
jgi:DNA mismatch repair protein MutL